MKREGATTYISAHNLRTQVSSLTLADDATSLILASTTAPRWLLQIFKSAVSRRSAWCVRPRSCRNKRWRAIDVELKLHYKMGRSSSISLMVVATGRSWSRSEVQSRPRRISNTWAQLRLCSASPMHRITWSLATGLVSLLAPPSILASGICHTQWGAPGTIREAEGARTPAVRSTEE
jgi:hypothetical protein